MSGAPARLTARGRFFLGYGNIGDLVELNAVAADHGLRTKLLAAGAAEPDPHVEHRLHELVAAPKP